MVSSTFKEVGVNSTRAILKAIVPFAKLRRKIRAQKVAVNLTTTCKDRKYRNRIACRFAFLSAYLVELLADLHFAPGPPCSLSRGASGFRKSGHERARPRGESVRRALDNGSWPEQRQHADCTRDGSNIDVVRNAK